MNRIVPATINTSALDAEANRIRQSVQHKKAVMLAEAALFRRQEALKNCRRPARIYKARRRLEVAEEKLIQIRIRGSI